METFKNKGREGPLRLLTNPGFLGSRLAPGLRGAGGGTVEKPLSASHTEILIIPFSVRKKLRIKTTGCPRAFNFDHTDINPKAWFTGLFYACRAARRASSIGSICTARMQTKIRVQPAMPAGPRRSPISRKPNSAANTVSAERMIAASAASA